MFGKGEAIIYGTQGVCVIDGIEAMSFGKEKREYYILKPVYDENSTIYAPTDNETVTLKMRRVLTKEEIDILIDSIGKEETEWIQNDSLRREFCESVINKGDRKELVQLVEMLYMRQKDLKSQKKHFHIADEKYLKEAEKIIDDELAYVLGIDRDRVPEYIAERINKEPETV